MGWVTWRGNGVAEVWGMGWAPPGTLDREVSPSRALGGVGRVPGMGSCRDRGLGAWVLLPALGFASQGFGLKTGERAWMWEQ